MIYSYLISHIGLIGKNDIELRGIREGERYVNCGGGGRVLRSVEKRWQKKGEQKWRGKNFKLVDLFFIFLICVSILYAKKNMFISSTRSRR